MITGRFGLRAVGPHTAPCARVICRPISHPVWVVEGLSPALALLIQPQARQLLGLYFETVNVEPFTLVVNELLSAARSLPMYASY